MPSLGRQWADAWSRHDIDGLASLFSATCIYEDVAFSVVNRGHAGVREWATGFLEAFPDLEVEGLREFGGRRHELLEWSMSGTHRGEFDGLAPTNRGWSVRGVSVFDLEDSLIGRCADYWNLRDVRLQLGASD